MSESNHFVDEEAVAPIDEETSAPVVEESEIANLARPPIHPDNDQKGTGRVIS